MKSVSFIILGIVLHHFAVAGQGAIAERNYQINYDSWDTYANGNNITGTYKLSWDMRLPISKYVGGTLDIYYQHANIGFSSYPNPSSTLPAPCTFSTKGYAVGFLLRDIDIGKMGITYGTATQHASCEATFVNQNSNELSTTNTSLYAEYYLSGITLSASRTHAALESASTFDTANITGKWYPINDLSIAIGADGLDLNKTYHLDLEFQPSAIGDMMSFTLNYSMQQTDIPNHTIGFGVHYFFDTQINLLERDRKYR